MAVFAVLPHILRPVVEGYGVFTMRVLYVVYNQRNTDISPILDYKGNIEGKWRESKSGILVGKMLLMQVRDPVLGAKSGLKCRKCACWFCCILTTTCIFNN